MSKVKWSFCVVLSLCFLGLLIWGSIQLFSGQFENLTPNPNQNLTETSELPFVPPLAKGETGDSGIISQNKKSAAERKTDQVQISTSPAPVPQGDPDPDRELLDLGSTKSPSVTMEISPSPSTKQSIYRQGNENIIVIEATVISHFPVDADGWITIQTRDSGTRQEFNRTWAEYQNGFSSLSGNFWLGLGHIRALTRSGDQELLIKLEDFEGEKRWAQYSSFSISKASDFYRLSIGGFSENSTAGDSMTNSRWKSEHMVNEMRFSTWDNDNDKLTSGNCADANGGGWWFNACGSSQLNGPYRQQGEKLKLGESMYWWSWKPWEPIAKTEMKIRKRKPESKSESE